MTTQPKPGVGTFRGIPYRAFGEFYLKNGVQTQLFTIDPSRRTTLVGEKGTRLTIHPFSLFDANGHSMHDEVTITLKEVFSKKDMVLSDRVTTSEDRLLESGGQVYVNAHRDGAQLHLKHPVTVELPIQKGLRNTLGMKLFKGGTSITRSIRGRRLFDWKMVSDSSLLIRKVNGQKFFAFNLNEFNWYNCDYFFARKRSRTMVSARCVSHIEEFDDQSAFLVFEDSNSVARMYYGGHSFTSFNIPVKLAATVVMMGLRDGQLYFGASSIDKTSSKLIHIKLNAVTEKQLLDQLEQL